MDETLLSCSIFAKSDFFHSSFKLNFGIFVKEIQNTARENVNFQSILFLADLRFIKKLWGKNKYNFYTY
jgi:hypothetical protein